MIDLRQDLSNFHAISLEKLLEDRKDLPDYVKNSITLYNKAIESLKAGSEDIAIIGLKKAVSMNPDFHEAVNLLGLCYAFTKDIDMATETFEKVVEAENNSIRALNYLQQINPAAAAGLSQAPMPTAQDKKHVRRTEQIKEPRHEKTASTILPSFFQTGERKHTGRYIAAFLAGALLVFLLGIAFRDDPGTYVSTQNDNGAQVTSNVSKKEYTDLKNKYEKLNDEYTTLENENEKTGSELDYYKNVISLYEVDDMIKARDYEKAADTLVLLGTAGFTDQHKEKYDSLCKTAYTKAAQQMLNEADKLIRSRKFQESLDILAKVMSYGDKPPYLDRILYYTGKCHRGLNDSRSAIAAFQRVLDECPTSGYVKYAKKAIDDLTPNP